MIRDFRALEDFRRSGLKLALEFEISSALQTQCRMGTLQTL